VSGTLVPVDATSELAVSDYLDKAREWLATAVEMTGPAEIAAAKAEIATAAEATKQLNLSKEIQTDALEMVRRAEYALGKAIRKGQDEGTIRRRGEIVTHYDRHSGDSQQTTNSTKASPTDFAPFGELSGARGDGIYALAVADPEQFEEAIEEAKTGGDLSRANVVREVQKAKRQASVNGVSVTRSPESRQQRADLIADLAAQGYSSRQMPAKVGVAEQSIRQIARDFDIEIPADRSQAGTRRISPALVVENTATALEGLAMGVELIDCREIDPALASQWVDSLSESMRALNRFVRQIKEQTQ